MLVVCISPRRCTQGQAKLVNHLRPGQDPLLPASVAAMRKHFIAERSFHRCCGQLVVGSATSRAFEFVSHILFRHRLIVVEPGYFADCIELHRAEDAPSRSTRQRSLDTPWHGPHLMREDGTLGRPPRPQRSGCGQIPGYSVANPPERGHNHKAGVWLRLKPCVLHCVARSQVRRLRQYRASSCMSWRSSAFLAEFANSMATK